MDYEGRAEGLRRPVLYNPAHVVPLVPLDPFAAAGAPISQTRYFSL